MTSLALLQCWFAVLVSFSGGNVIIKPVPTPPADESVKTGDLSRITGNSDETHINQVLGNNGSKIILGDIISDEETLRFITQDPRGRNAIKHPHGLWPGNTVPYIIDRSIEQKGNQAIKDAISDFHRLTCLKFVGRTTQKNYIKFVRSPLGCSSSVGRTARGQQKINLHQHCWRKGIVIHEILHAVGFFHEQSRSDRDSYVRVLYENIEQGKENNFDKFSQNEIQHLGEPYDYGSILHYGPKAFTKNGLATIIALKSGGNQIGQRTALSANDIRQINKLYKCPKKPTSRPNTRPVVYCSFDSFTSCNFRQDTADDFDWTLRRGRTPSGRTGPRTDMSGKGSYIYAEASTPRKHGDRAVLLSPLLRGSYCLRLHFHMLGTNMGSLNAYKLSQGSVKTAVFSISGNKGDQWYEVHTSLTGDEQFEIAFEAVRGNSYRGDIAMDEIKLSPGNCDDKPAPTPTPPDTTPPPVRPTTKLKPLSRSEVYCNFDAQSLCQFTQGTGDQFDWTLNKGTTSSAPHTGPSNDVSLRGYYIYAEASFPRRNGDLARLVSPRLAGKYCLQFYYHMYGADVGTLQVTMLAGSANSTVITNRVGARGNRWYPVKANIRVAHNYQYQVVFEAQRGRAWAGDIALDEIRLTPGDCSQFATTTTLPPPAPTTKLTTPAVKQVHCNFDSKSWCGFTQDNKDDFDWTRHRGRTSSFPTTGPTTDFLGNGYYIYAEASSPRKPGERARLISPRLTGVTCVVFRYHMKGAKMGSLRVYSKAGSMQQLLWQRGGNQGDAWNGMQLRVTTSAQFQIIFEAVRGGGYQSDIALDEIRFIPGRCMAAEPIETTTSIPKPTPTIHLPSSRHSGSRCPSGWSKHRGSCYKAYNARYLWHRAKALCGRHGGYLVAIENANEQSFVKSMATKLNGDYAIWIGLRRDSRGRFSSWDNGKPLSYTKWVRNEPNNLLSDEDCVEMLRYSGGWLDTTCTGFFARKHPFICEITLTRNPATDSPLATTRPPVSCGVKTAKPSSFAGPAIGQIVGGKISTPGAWPWQAAIMCKTCEKQDCGGTLVSAYHVVTAAHCVLTNNETFIKKYKVRLGEHHFEQTEGYEQDIAIASVTVHRSYGVRTSFDRDVAVIKLASPARFNDHVGPVCLQNNNADFPPGTPCSITGWGRTSQGGSVSAVLREASVPIVSPRDCKENYGNPSVITSNMLCAGLLGAGVDACQGDSGGPLVCEKDNRWYLVGTTSWGWGCAGQYYGVYSNIARLYNWIKANME